MITDLIKQTRRFLIFTVGGSLLIIALILIPLPGPGILLSVLALAFLATEFIWAQRLLVGLRKEARSIKGKVDGTALGKKMSGSFLSRKLDKLFHHPGKKEDEKKDKKKLDTD